MIIFTQYLKIPNKGLFSRKHAFYLVCFDSGSDRNYSVGVVKTEKIWDVVSLYMLTVKNQSL